MTILLVVVLATIGISATCSLLEATLMSTRVPSLEAAKGGPHGAAAVRLIEMKRDIAAPTSAILIMNTVANTAGATLAGSLAADAFGTAALAPFSIVFTLAILFLAEIIPKTLGAMQWRSIWRFIVWPLAMLQRGLGPAVWLTQKATSALLGGGQHKPTTEGEIAAMIRLGATVGELSRTELELLTSVLRFDDMRVSEVLVPRHDVKTLRVGTTVAQALDVVGQHLHTRYPVCGEGLDDAQLVVHVKDLCAPAVEPTTLVRDLARPLARIPETMALPALMRQMQRTKQHMALVIDEFGSATGIVTMENLLEQIVGTVEDEFDHETKWPAPQAGGARVVPGGIPLRVLAELFDPPLSGDRVETLNGWILEQLGRLPRKGDVVRAPALRIEVLEVKRDQATSVRISPGQDDEPAPESTETESPPQPTP